MSGRMRQIKRKWIFGLGLTSGYVGYSVVQCHGQRDRLHEESWRLHQQERTIAYCLSQVEKMDPDVDLTDGKACLDRLKKRRSVLHTKLNQSCFSALIPQWMFELGANPDESV